MDRAFGRPEIVHAAPAGAGGGDGAATPERAVQTIAALYARLEPAERRGD